MPCIRVFAADKVVVGANVFGDSRGTENLLGLYVWKACLAKALHVSDEVVVCQMG